MTTIGTRLELAREWIAGTYAPTRSGGYPTIWTMRRAVDVPRRVPLTYMEIACYGAFAIAAVVVCAAVGW